MSPKKSLVEDPVKQTKPQAESIKTEEHTGFRAVRSITEQSFNSRVSVEK